MPTWVILASSVITSIIIVGGALSFPYVPMLFGVYGAEQYSSRGWLIVKLLWLFPVASIVFLYAAWTSNGLFAIAPFGYLFFLWLIRANKDAGSGPSQRYASKQENLHSIRDAIDANWDLWRCLVPAKSFLFLTVFTPDAKSSSSLKLAIEQTGNLHSKIEENTYNNNTSTMYICLKINSLDKGSVLSQTKDILSIIWGHQCELSAIEIMQDDD